MSGELLGLLLAFLAGSATALGSLTIFFVKRVNRMPFVFCMAASAGVMLYISFTELLHEASDSFVKHYETLKLSHEKAHAKAELFTPIAFFLGWLFASVLDKITHQILSHHAGENTQENFEELPNTLLCKNKVNCCEDDIEGKDCCQRNTYYYYNEKNKNNNDEICDQCGDKQMCQDQTTIGHDKISINSNLKKKKSITIIQKIVNQFNCYFNSTKYDANELAQIAFAESQFQHDQHCFIRLGLLTGLVLALHNFPEGIATYISAVKEKSIGAGMAIGIGLHNIPEGFAVAVPIYFGTGSKNKALFYSILSGMAEPLGALLCYFIFQKSINALAMGWILAITAGIMSNIALLELFKTASKYDPLNYITGSVFYCSMVIMAFTIYMIH